MKYLFGSIILLMYHVLPAQTTVLTVKNIALGIDVGGGGRVVSFRLAGREILGTAAIHPRFYGSSLWLSPENKWKGMGALDSGPYKVLNSGLNVLELGSATDTGRGFSFTKTFRMNAADTSVAIHYTITNHAAGNQEVAPWEVTRVPTGGLAFFPSGKEPALNKSDLKVIDSLRWTWYAYDTTTHVRQKLFRHGAEGWTAYVREGVLFVKKYTVIQSGTAAPGEENVEMYVNPERTYIELENQGPYQVLMPGSTLQYDVKWYARQLPAGITPAVGDKDLIDYIKQFIHAHEK